MKPVFQLERREQISTRENNLKMKPPYINLCLFDMRTDRDLLIDGMNISN